MVKCVTYVLQLYQGSQRTSPPQFTPQSLPSKLVEMWEKLPQSIKEETDNDRAKEAIKNWIFNCNVD